jgi:hypothetical protein
VLKRLLFVALLVPIISACDATYYLALVNQSPSDLLVRSVFAGNRGTGLADPVRPANQGESIWVATTRIGRGPDTIELLTTDCQVIYTMKAPDSGTLTIDTTLSVTFDRSAAPKDASSPDLVEACPNR